MVSDEPHKIQKLWPRDPKGPILPSAGQPQGIRTPNGQIWGHDINDFYYIERLPGAQVKTVWSISMISEFGETYGDTEGRLEDDCLEPWRTRVRKPFPLLKFPDGIHCDQQIGLEDEGSLYCLNQASEKAEAVEVRKDGYEPELIFGTDLPPALEEFIPPEFFPDILLIQDTDGCASGARVRPLSEVTSKSMSYLHEKRIHRYRRALPDFGPESSSRDQKRVATIDISAKLLYAMGHNSSVYRAPLSLPTPLTTNSRSKGGQVTVVAKIAFPELKARKHLSNEAEMLDIISKRYEYLQEEWCGLNKLRTLDSPVPTGPVVPKFFGYYIPDEEEHSKALSPVLLMEDCGSPVNIQTLSQDQKEQALSLLVHLHNSGFLHGKSTPRNILSQSGPLTRCPTDRLLSTPTLRIISYGSSAYKTGTHGKYKYLWEKALLGEQEALKKELDMGDTVVPQVLKTASKLTEEELSMLNRE